VLYVFILLFNIKMISQIITYREQQLELDRERLRYIRFNTILDAFILISIFFVIIGICCYIIIIMINNKKIE